MRKHNTDQGLKGYLPAEGYLPDSICTWELLIGSATDQTRLRPRKIYGWLQPQVELSWEHFKFMIRKSDCFIVCEMDRWSPECAVKGGREEGREEESTWIGIELDCLHGRRAAFVKFVYIYDLWIAFYDDVVCGTITLLRAELKVWICHFIW